ncbi:MAG: hypothetical protein QXL24_01680 [Candidatus Jordarchaeaceae archaeon]
MISSPLCSFISHVGLFSAEPLPILNMLVGRLTLFFEKKWMIKRALVRPVNMNLPYEVPKLVGRVRRAEAVCFEGEI